MLLSFNPSPTKHARFDPFIATNLAQDAWLSPPCSSIVDYELTLSIQYYGRPMDLQLNKVLDDIGRIEKQFASDGSFDNNVCLCINGRGTPVMVRIVCKSAHMCSEESKPVEYSVRFGDLC